MMNQGQVVGGQYINAIVDTNFKGEVVLESASLRLQFGFKKLPKFTPAEVAGWNEVTTEGRSGAAGAVGAVGQAIAGAVLPGFMGKAASAALGATIDVTMRPPRTVRVDWADGKQSLVKLPEKLYRHFEMVLEDQRVHVVEPDPESVPMTAPNFDVSEHLTKLAMLRDQGILTDAEFTSKKTQLLARL